MNFRVNLAVALAAAFSFACAEKASNIPELEAALVAPPGMKVVGLYRMDVTPVATPQGVQFYTDAVPVGADGNPATNPPGTVAVKGSFGAVTPWAGGGIRCTAGVNTLNASVTVTNFTFEPLTNVYAQILDMAGNTGNTACNPTQNGTFGASERTMGVWQYPNLAASAVADGSAAGGSGSATWTLRYVTTTPFRFFFRVVAENTAPVMPPVDPAGPSAPFAWTSTVSANTLLDICPADPGLNIGNPCPVALSLSAPVAGTGVGPWSFSYAFPASTLVAGNRYWARVRNVLPLGNSIFSTIWMAFTYQAVPTVPTILPTTVAANIGASPGAQAIVTWTTVPTVMDSYMYLCQGPCPATLPLAANPVQGNVLFQGAFQDPGPTTTAFYMMDVAPFLLVDAVTLTYWDPAVAYEVRVFEYDGINQPIVAANGSAASLTVTPIQLLPVVTEPVSYSSVAATWPVTWTADPVFTTTQVDACMPDCLNDPFPSTAIVTAVAGVYSQDIRLLTGALAPGQTFELRVYNPDLYQVYGAGGLRTVVP